MTLQERLLDDMKTAMKSKDAETLGVLRMLKAALLNLEKESGEAGLDDAQVITALQKEAKKRRDAIDSFVSGGRQDLADVETAELEIINRYLPAPFTDDEIRAIIQEVIAGLDAPQFGSVMGPVMARVSGRADGAVVKQLIQEQLQ